MSLATYYEKRDFKKTRELFAETIAVAVQISKIGDLMHRWALKNSSSCQLSGLPEQKRFCGKINRKVFTKV